MYISNCYSRIFDLQIRLENIEKNILEIQAKIYKASQACKIKNIYKQQKAFLINRYIFLVIVRDAIIAIKKKLIYGIFI